MKKIICTIVSILYFNICVATAGDSFHVTVQGKPEGNGTLENPWDLNTALNRTSVIRGGDTVWVHSGTYLGVFRSTLRGNAAAPVIVKAVSDFDVILDGNVASSNQTLAIEGQYVWYIGLTVTCSNPNRIADGPSPVNTKDGIYFIGRNNKLINCVIRDNGGNGIGFWSPAIDSEIYGCIIYHNGYRGNDRGHGHGIYTQNAQGTKLITDNIFFNSFGIGIHAYTENGAIQGFKIEGNTFFNSGLPGADFLERHIIAGGLQPVDRTVVTNNYFYFKPRYPAKAGVQFGYSSANYNAEFTNNYMVDGSFYTVRNWRSIQFTGNTMVSTIPDLQLIAFDSFSNIQNPTFNNNTYYRGNLASLSFQGWKNLTNQDGSSNYFSSEPAETNYFIRKNQYEAGRANLTIFNWYNSQYVNVNVSDILTPGDTYELYDVSRLSKGPTATGVFDGISIAVSMEPTEVDLPNGHLPNLNQFEHTAPRFGVFIIKRTKSNSEVSNHDVTNPGGQRSNPLKAWAHNGLLHISGLTVGETLHVYSASGVCVYRTVITSREMRFHLKMKGIYFIQSADHSVRVVAG